jgi:hypothetical protein
MFVDIFSSEAAASSRADYQRRGKSCSSGGKTCSRKPATQQSNLYSTFSLLITKSLNSVLQLSERASSLELRIFMQQKALESQKALQKPDSQALPSSVGYRHPQVQSQQSQSLQPTKSTPVHGKCS